MASYATTIAGIASLVGWWRLSEPSGTVAIDSKNGNSGVIGSNVNFSQAGMGLAGNGIQFLAGNSGSNVDIPGDTHNNITGNWSIGAIIKLTNSPSNGPELAVAGKYTPTQTAPFVDYGIFAQSSNNGSYGINFAPNGGALTTLHGVTKPVAGVYHYIVGTYDGATLSLYYDGVLDNSVAQTGATQNDAQDFIIAARKFSGIGFNGLLACTITNIELYNAAISSGQVLTNFNSISATDPVPVSAAALLPAM